jgi:hypothetical protein
MAIATKEPIESTSLAVLQPLPVEALIAKAIEHNISVESLEKLLGMRERLKAEAAREAFIDAMAAFQAECPTIPKSKVAGSGSYSYRYAPLEAIVEATSKLRARHGFSYRFDTRFEDSPPAQVVLCIVSHREGHAESSEFRSPIDAGARMNVMQQSASALTYAKRYAFINAFGIVTGDEDNDAQTVAKERVTRQIDPQAPPHGVPSSREPARRAAEPPAESAPPRARAGGNTITIKRPEADPAKETARLRDLVLRRAVEIKRAQAEKDGEITTDTHLRTAAAESIIRVFEKSVESMSLEELTAAAAKLADFLTAMEREVPA